MVEAGSMAIRSLVIVNLRNAEFTSGLLTFSTESYGAARLCCVLLKTPVKPSPVFPRSVVSDLPVEVPTSLETEATAAAFPAARFETVQCQVQKDTRDASASQREPGASGRVDSSSNGRAAGSASSSASEPRRSKKRRKPPRNSRVRQIARAAPTPHEVGRLRFALEEQNGQSHRHRSGNDQFLRRRRGRRQGKGDRKRRGRAHHALRRRFRELCATSAPTAP